MRDLVVELKESIEKNWDSIALTDYSGGEVTYGQLYTETKELYKIWKAQGVFPGDKVTILSHNCINWLKVYLAAILNGYIAILVPENLSTELTNDIIKHSECKILFTSTNYASSVHKINPDLTIWDIQSLSPLFKTSSRKKPENSTDNFVINENGVCTIIYTSGSMGEPKGVMISYRNIAYQETFITKWIKNYQESRYHVNFLPFAHIYGLMCDALSSILLGVQLIIMGANNSAPNLLRVLQKYKPSILLSVPMMIDGIISLMGHPRSYYNISEAELKELRQRVSTSLGGGFNAILTGGAPITKEFESLLIDKLKLPFVSGYGTTECGILSAGTVGNYQNGSCGKMFDPDVIRIVRIHKGDKSGEVQIKGESVFCGYYKDPLVTILTFTEDGWFKTGDLGYIDENGNLFITGRCKDMLLTSNGENIYPEPIEAVFNASPYITESVLVQKGHALRGGATY